MISGEFWVLAVVNVVAAAARWGRSEAMHNSNTKLLEEVRLDVRRINGTVTRHDEQLKILKGD